MGSGNLTSESLARRPAGPLWGSTQLDLLAKCRRVSDPRSGWSTSETQGEEAGATTEDRKGVLSAQPEALSDPRTLVLASRPEGASAQPAEIGVSRCPGPSDAELGHRALPVQALPVNGP